MNWIILNCMNIEHGKIATKLLSPSMAASNAECLQYSDVQAGVSLAIWQNQEDHVVNENVGLHTLSMYLEGGNNAYRTDLQHRYGGPGKICFMPSDHQSEWYVDEPLRLMHLYFTDEHLSYLALTAFDIDPRLLQLQDLTYEQDGQLAKGLQCLLSHMKQENPADILMLQQSQQQLLLYMLERYTYRTQKTIRGGLSPQAKRLVLEYMETHMDQKISLHQLADIACLSSYHFSHMFKQTMGLSPYQYLLKHRMQSACEMFNKHMPLSQIIQNCGYSSHSRFSRAFRGVYGITPSTYQKHI